MKLLQAQLEALVHANAIPAPEHQTVVIPREGNPPKAVLNLEAWAGEFIRIERKAERAELDFNSLSFADVMDIQDE